MTQKQLIVRVRADGTIDAETVGMYGAECLDYFDALEDLLGATTSGSAYTADFDRVSAEDETGVARGVGDGQGA
ncbi:DUF2997 domain-containing protein [Microbacterium sp.]|uniref:DUF2997 domain-containing protein n=1 Tax=Microbacterium sp. TaxID=51671 RepID=UPI002811F1FF|nr:DUF2997 domain-containing protein [Microbacterium sp.]